MGLGESAMFLVWQEGNKKYVVVACREHGKPGELLVGTSDGKTLAPEIFCGECGLKKPPRAAIAGWDSFAEMEKEKEWAKGQ